MPTFIKAERPTGITYVNIDSIKELEVQHMICNENCKYCVVAQFYEIGMGNAILYEGVSDGACREFIRDVFKVI